MTKVGNVESHVRYWLGQNVVCFDVKLGLRAKDGMSSLIHFYVAACFSDLGLGNDFNHIWLNLNMAAINSCTIYERNSYQYGGRILYQHGGSTSTN